MTLSDSKPVLTPLQALSRYQEDLSVRLADNSMGVLPGVIGTVFFERGSQPEVRQAILDCFDRFAEMFGENLKGGKDTDEGKFTKRNEKGIEKIRRAIIDTPSHLKVSVVLSSATDQDTAAEYDIATLTGSASARDYVHPTGLLRVAKGRESGLSYLKFNVPMDVVTTDDGIAQYEEFLRYVCKKLVVRGGYGGLSPILPYSYHRYMPQEWALADRFNGLEIDSTAHFQAQDYYTSSYEGESKEEMTAHYDYLHPGAKVARWGFIKSVNWYTILGELFIERLGGEAVIREKLDRPDIHIERANACLMIRAGDFPRLGAPEEGLPEPYVFVNSVLRALRDPKPDALHTYIPDLPSADTKNARKWVARFDLPDAPPIPEPPTIVPQPVKREPARQNVRGGNPCPEAGWWHTPAKAGSRRYFEVGEIMPVIEGSQWGTTNWHWSPTEKQ
ncbi:type VI immunity family protein [Burkholderia lata]|uniref:GP30 family protein n=1 Tax=Burkholderia lata (strain ATCC 17760 / DSM 23089 / LMG 22485 / NCIMB 9086 / R18194 / 383) TaxID=482957 RepID=A0A6P2I4N5_BURL3|nr:type VI immunity family protein [Burkholderia lata]VWB24610.1 GP30 family protein [Burkholderia lata]